MTEFPDHEIGSQILAGQHPVAASRMAFRQMKALETIAECLLKLASPSTMSVEQAPMELLHEEPHVEEPEPATELEPHRRRRRGVE